MMPADFNLVLYRGDTGRWQFRLWADADKTDPIDLTGVTVQTMLRDKATSGSFVIVLDCVVTLPNIIDMTLTSEQSRDLPPKGVWDLQLTYPSGDIVTPLKGTVSVTQDVTYAAASGAGYSSGIKRVVSLGWMR
jgi:hypothetical protein